MFGKNGIHFFEIDFLLVVICRIQLDLFDRQPTIVRWNLWGVELLSVKRYFQVCFRALLPHFLLKKFSVLRSDLLNLLLVNF